MEISAIHQVSTESGQDMQVSVTRTKTQNNKSNTDLQFVEFTLGSECFAINLFNTKEVITPTSITPLPNSVAYIKGVMDLRGTITTIIDLKLLLNISETRDSKKRSRIIILDNDPSEKSVGILVDDVYSVSTHHASDIERETDDKTHSTRFILGVIRISRSEKHNLVLWLDIQKIRASITSEL